MRVRTYGFPGGFTRPTGTSARNHPHEDNHVEACRPQGMSYAQEFTYPYGVPATIACMEHVEWRPPTSPAPVPPIAPEDVGLPPTQPRSRLKRAFGPLAVLGAGAAKFKGVLLLLPKLKLLTTSGTMLVSVAAYSLIWGLPFAAGFVVLLLVHEMGHVIQLRREGIKASAPMFIPFLGAVVMTKSLGGNALAEARVGLAGPVLGSLGALLLIPVWHATGNDMWRALAFTGFFLNLFNLLPVVPLDGGRAMAAMAPWMWFVGFAALIGVAIAFPEPDHLRDPAVRRDGDVAALEGTPRRRGGRRGLLPRRTQVPRACRAGVRRSDRRAGGRDGSDALRARPPELTRLSAGSRGQRDPCPGTFRAT